MTTGPDITGPTGRDPEAALTPEERALAERIVRTGPQREPAPALDARVLAAARAAVAAPVATPASRRQRSRRRWPMVAGVAATLVLAVGLAWQLRPVDETRGEYSEVPRAAVVLTPNGGPSAVADDAEPVRESALPRQVAAPAPQAMGMPAEDTAAPAAAVAKAPAEPKPESGAKAGAGAKAESKSAPPPEPPVVFDAPSPVPMEAPTPPPAGFERAPPAPPPAPVAARRAAPQPSAMPPGAATSGIETEARARKQQAQASSAAAVAGAADGTTAIGNFAVEAAPAKARNEAEAADARALDRVETTGGDRVDRFADQPLDDQPPASADSPQVREAWLRRVRQLVAEGRIDAARDSLREYQHRYPKAVLPDDLRTLLEE